MADNSVGHGGKLRMRRFTGHRNRQRLLICPRAPPAYGLCGRPCGTLQSAYRGHLARRFVILGGFDGPRITEPTLQRRQQGDPIPLEDQVRRTSSLLLFPRCL